MVFTNIKLLKYYWNLPRNNSCAKAQLISHMAGGIRHLVRSRIIEFVKSSSKHCEVEF
jgi:hypothetical protein